jgi:hypothetical protein
MAGEQQQPEAGGRQQGEGAGGEQQRQAVMPALRTSIGELIEQLERVRGTLTWSSEIGDTAREITRLAPKVAQLGGALARWDQQLVRRNLSDRRKSLTVPLRCRNFVLARTTGSEPEDTP